MKIMLTPISIAPLHQAVEPLRRRALHDRAHGQSERDVGDARKEGKPAAPRTGHQVFPQQRRRAVPRQIGHQRRHRRDQRARDHRKAHARVRPEHGAHRQHRHAHAHAVEDVHLGQFRGARRAAC